MAVMAILIGAPVSLRDVDPFVAFNTAAAKVGDHHGGGERVGALANVRGGKSDAGQTYAGSVRMGRGSAPSWFSTVDASRPSDIVAAHPDAEEAAASTKQTTATARAALDPAVADLAKAKAALGAANARLAAAQAASDVANSRYKAAKAALDAAMVAFEADPVNPDLGAALDEAGFDLDEAVGAQVDVEIAVEGALTAQASAVAIYDAAIRGKDGTQARLGASGPGRAVGAASGQLAVVAVASNEKAVSDGVLDTLRHLLGI